MARITIVIQDGDQHPTLEADFLPELDTDCAPTPAQRLALNLLNAVETDGWEVNEGEEAAVAAIP